MSESERRHGFDSDYHGPERRQARTSGERQILQLTAAIAEIQERLSDSGARMDDMQAELSRNTQVTDEVRDILSGSKGGLKALGALGAIASWVTKIGIAVGVLWGLWSAFKSGKPPGG